MVLTMTVLGSSGDMLTRVFFATAGRMMFTSMFCSMFTTSMFAGVFTCMFPTMFGRCRCRCRMFCFMTTTMMFSTRCGSCLCNRHFDYSFSTCTIDSRCEKWDVIYCSCFNVNLCCTPTVCGCYILKCLFM
jgi:hypothetical protein